MKHQMRELRGDDLFILLSILSKLNVKDDIIAMFEQTQKPLTLERMAELKEQYPDDEEYKKALTKEIDEAIQKRGIRVVADLVVKVMASVGHVKEDIHSLLAQLCGVSLKEIKELGLLDYTQIVMAFFKKPELRDFLKLLKPLLLSENQTETSETASTS